MFETLYPNAPLTQTEMNVDSAKRFAEVEQDRKQLIAKLGPMTGDLERVETAWEAYRDLAVELEAGYYKGGSIYPMIWSSEAASLTRQHVQWLQQVLDTRSR